MAAILDMRKYPPHCPRPSTNSPIHPRADSTLQPAVAAVSPRPAFHDSTSLPHEVTPLPACSPATPTSLQSQGRRLPAGKGDAIFLLLFRTENFLENSSFILSLAQQHCNNIVRCQYLLSVCQFGNVSDILLARLELNLTNIRGRRSRRNLKEIMSRQMRKNQSLTIIS